jgi:hypothetical protein
MPGPKFLIVSLTLAAPLLIGCGSDDSAGREPLGSVSGYSVVLQDNDQGPDAPCVGVEMRTTDGTSVTVACPTLPTEEDQYAAVIGTDSGMFVVGFGLAENETLVADGFVDVFISDAVDGRRFFAAQLEDGEAVEAVTVSDGMTTRELSTA